MCSKKRKKILQHHLASQKLSRYVCGVQTFMECHEVITRTFVFLMIEDDGD